MTILERLKVIVKNTVEVGGGKLVEFDENLFTVEFPKVKHNQISTDSIALIVELRRLVSTILFINFDYFPYQLTLEKLEINYPEGYLRTVSYFEKLKDEK